MGATHSSGNTKLSLADRRYKVNSPRGWKIFKNGIFKRLYLADSLLVQQRHSGRKLGGVALEPRDNPQCTSTTKESFTLNNDSQKSIIDPDTMETGKINRRSRSGSNGSINSNDTLNSTSPSRVRCFSCGCK
uniref:Uncharacterized protein n=1 Tax=Meloidogyne hapla TaxID=6305 RepID=A0A1I8AZ11_MELHA